MEDKTPSNGNKKEKNNQGIERTDDCLNPAKSLDDILEYNCSAFSNETIYDENDKRKKIVQSIKKIDGNPNTNASY